MVSNVLVLDGTGHNVTISGNRAVQIFNVQTGASLTINSIALSEGLAENGGAIFNDGGSLNLANCHLLNNTAFGTNGVHFPMINVAFFDKTATVISAHLRRNQPNSRPS